MSTARSRDVLSGLQHVHKHFHKLKLDGPLVVLLDQPAIRKAFLSDVRLRAEAREWVATGMNIMASVSLVLLVKETELYSEELLNIYLKKSMQVAADETLNVIELKALPLERGERLSHRFRDMDHAYSEVMGKGHRLTQAYADRILGRKCIVDEMANRAYQEWFVQFTAEQEVARGQVAGPEGASDAKRQRVEGVPEVDAPAPNTEGPLEEGSTGPDTPPAQLTEKGVGRTSPDEPARPLLLPAPAEGNRGADPEGKAPAHVGWLPPSNNNYGGSGVAAQPLSNCNAAAASNTGTAAASNVTASAAEPAPAVIIACCSYRGDAGSTTTAINLGYTLVEEYSCRTCYVDCDPQCSLTAFFSRQVASSPKDRFPGMGNATGSPRLPDGSMLCDSSPDLGIFQLPEMPNQGKYPEKLCQQGSFDRKGRPFRVTLKRVLEAAFKGKPTPADILHFKTKLDDDGQEEYPGFKHGLFLLPGDKDLHLMLEPRVKQARGQLCSNNAENVRKEAHMVLGGFREALHDIARAHCIKYMICDFGPSSSEANQMLLASCDYIIPTFQPDLFSASSVHGLLHTVLPSLVRQQAEMGQLETTRSVPGAHRAYRFNPSPPRLLPLLMTGFYLDGSGTKAIVRTEDAHVLDLVAKAIDAADVPKEDLSKHPGNCAIQPGGQRVRERPCLGAVGEHGPGP
eukprot:jgi/Mesvir1/9570/Mv12748-RA.2